MADDDSATVTKKEIRAMAGPWWLSLVVGILWLVFSFAILTSSSKINTIAAIGLLAGVVFFLGGIMELFLASAMESQKWIAIVMGIIGVIAGIVCFIHPSQSFWVIAIVIAWYLLFKGTFDIIESLMVRKDVDVWWLGLISGIIEIAIGFWAVGSPQRSAILLVLWVAAAALIRGITMIMLSFRIKHMTAEAA